MDTYQSPLQIISQQENHQNHQTSNHQQVYLIEFQPQHMATAATSLDHHIHQHQQHHHPPHQHQHHHLHEQPHQQQHQPHHHHHHHQQPQPHHHHHHQPPPPPPQQQQPTHHHHHAELQPQLTLMNGASAQQHQHQLVTNSVGPMLNGTGGLHAPPLSHYCHTGNEIVYNNDNNNNQEEYSEIITDYQQHHNQVTMQCMQHMNHATNQQLNTSPDQQQLQQAIQLHPSPNGLQQHHQHQHLLQQQQQQQQQQTIQLQPQQNNLAGLVTTVTHQPPHQLQAQQTNLASPVTTVAHQLQPQQTNLASPVSTVAHQPPIITATSTTPNNQPVRRKRKRCGACPGCKHKDNCGECGPCKSVRSHQICKMRKCDRLKHKRQATGRRTSQPGERDSIPPNRIS